MKRAWVFLGLFFFLSSAEAQTLFHNGHFVIGDKNKTVATWLFERHGQVVSFGKGKPDSDLPAAEKIDLGGKWVYPGLTDSHAHLVSLGEDLSRVDLRGAKSPEEAVQRVRQWIAKEKPKGVVVGRGWDQSDWPGEKFPNRQQLDKLPTKLPVVLTRIDGHAAWVNTAALKKTPLWLSEKDPEGGKILREGGKPTGILIDTAMHALEALVPAPTEEELAARIRLTVDKAVQLGMTGLHDAGAKASEIEATRKVLRDGSVRFRFFEMVTSEDKATMEAYLKKGPEIGGEDGQLTVRTVKLFADGAMGSRGAAFKEPYSDDPNNRGLLRYTPTELEAVMKRIKEAGFQVAIHAIGSAANAQALDAVERVYGTEAKAARVRLEHAQVLEEADIARAGKLGVIASMQPIHCASDMKWVVDRIGKKRARFAYPWKSLQAAGVPLAFGSDAPVDDFNPWHGMFVAIMRSLPDGNKTFYPKQAIDFDTAFEGYTRGAAHAAFQEAVQGTLAEGAFADFFVTGKEIKALTPRQIYDNEVEETYVGGKRVWPKAQREISSS